jgi:hypothetical protein
VCVVGGGGADTNMEISQKWLSPKDTNSESAFAPCYQNEKPTHVTLTHPKNPHLMPQSKNFKIFETPFVQYSPSGRAITTDSNVSNKKNPTGSSFTKLTKFAVLRTFCIS